MPIFRIIVIPTIKIDKHNKKEIYFAIAMEDGIKDDIIKVKTIEKDVFENMINDEYLFRK